MKVAIPTRNRQVDDHFGHCELYTVYTIDDNKNIADTRMYESPQGCGCKSNIGAILSKNGVSTMLAGHMGEGAYQMLTMYGIKVIRGCSGSTDSVIQDYLEDKLTDNAEACEQNQGHQHGHGHQCNH